MGVNRINTLNAEPNSDQIVCRFWRTRQGNEGLTGLILYTRSNQEQIMSTVELTLR